MPEPKRARAEAALDDVSDHLGVMLQRADELLVQWSAFGASVRGQVEREAATLGDAVAGTVDAAVARATATGVERALTEQLGGRLAALTTEIAKLEARTRAARAAIGEQRTGDRRILWGVVGGIAIANALLVAILLRSPPAAAPVAAEPAKVDVVAPPSAGSAEPAPPAVADPQPPSEPAASWPREIAPPPEASKHAGPSPVQAPAGTMGASAAPPTPVGAGASVTPGAKLPPRVRPHRR